MSLHQLSKNLLHKWFHCVLMEPDKYTAKKYTCVILSRLLLFLSLTIKVMQWEPRDSSGTYQGKAVGGGGPSLDCGQRPGLQDLKPHRTFVELYPWVILISNLSVNQAEHL